MLVMSRECSTRIGVGVGAGVIDGGSDLLGNLGKLVRPNVNRLDRSVGYCQSRPFGVHGEQFVHQDDRMSEHFDLAPAE